MELLLQKSLFSYFSPHSINKEWENRWSAKLGKTRSLKKKNKPAENHIDNHVWKGKQLQGPPTLPRFAVSDHLSRPEGQRRGLSTSNSKYNDKRGYYNLNRLQLLNFITQTQPSSTMWGKSWKYNKSLPPLEEGSAATSEWGKCWMFATWQPYSEAGKPWQNGPNIIDPQTLHLWRKPAYREVESQDLDVSLPTEEWKVSWRKSDKNHKEEGLSIKEENVPQSGLFRVLVETQQNETSLEWSNSWKVIKPTSEIPNGAQNNESIANKQHKDREMSSKWDDSWRLVNHDSCNKSSLPQVQKSFTLEWSDSWRAAMVVPNHRISDCSLTQDPGYTNKGHFQQKKSQLHKVLLESQKLRFRDMYLQLCDEFMCLSEWGKSWQVTKNNSKPCEEIEKVLKLSLSRMETTTEKVKDTNKHYSTTETTDLSYEQLKHDVVHQPKRELTKNNILHLKQHKNASSASEWTGSWKMLRHQTRMERRRMTPDPLRSFRSSENGANMKPTVSEWKDSWKFHCQPLYQETELWQQGWSTWPQMRVDRVMSQNHFMPVERPKNGPTGEHRWEESWRFLRSHHRSDPRHSRTQSSHVRSSETSHHPSDSLPQSSVRQKGYASSTADWQKAWMVSDTQSPLDNPSLTQWRESWKWSFNTENWTEQLTRVNEVNVIMEIQPGRGNVSLQEAESKISRLFDNQIFRERYPEEQWSTSWRAGSLLNHQHSNCRSSEIPGEIISRTTQQQCVTANEHGSKWGISFRLANPMPHMEHTSVESTSNPCHYTVLWSREKNMQNNINTTFSNNRATFKLWGNSHQFLQGVRPQIKDKTKSTEPVDPWVIITNMTKNKRHLYFNMEREKQSQRKWAGCHLLGKTQPRPKKGPASVEKHNVYDDKFLEEWAESWRHLIDHGFLKMKMAVKSLSEWKMSWKFLLSPYQPMNSPKAK